MTLAPATSWAALSVLATVIVALQVAVRPGASLVDGDLSQQIARIRVLEGLAAMAGLAAGLIGVLGALGVEPVTLASQPLETLAPIAVGLLLAVVATDAATASSNKYGPLVASGYRHQFQDRQRRARTRLAYHDDLAKSISVGEREQWVIIVGALALLSIVPAFALSKEEPAWNLAVSSFIVLGIGVASTAVAAGLAWHEARLKNWAAVFMPLVLGGLVGALSVLSALHIALQQASNDGDAARAAALFFLNCLLLTLTVTLTCAPPLPRFAPGTSRRLSDERYAATLAPPRAGDPNGHSCRRSAGEALIGLAILLTGLLPPLGLLVASYTLGTTDKRKRRRCATGAVILSVIMMTGALVVLLHPAFLVRLAE